MVYLEVVITHFGSSSEAVDTTTEHLFFLIPITTKPSGLRNTIIYYIN